MKKIIITLLGLAWLISSNITSAEEAIATVPVAVAEIPELEPDRADRSQPHDSASKPNVIIILADDMAWRDPGFMGSEFHQTPNLDALAREATVYTQAYATSPSCTPSRAGLLTGQYPSKFNIFTVGHGNNGPSFMQRFSTPENHAGLPRNVETLPSMLNKAGYHTGLVGKWHLGGEYHLQSFDHVAATFKAGHVKSHFAPFPETLEASEPLQAKPGDYLTDLLNRAAVNFIKNHPEDKPFALLLSHYAPHTPYQARKQDREPFNNSEPDGGHRNPTYAGMLKAIDRGVEQIIKTLEDNGELENTIIIFTSDNGGDHVVTSAAPLRGEKSMLFEGGIRVPMLVYYPKRFSAGQNPEPVSHLDILPTIARLSGASMPETLDGTSLLSLEDKQRPLFWYAPVYAPGYSPDAIDLYYRQKPAAVIRKGPWKLHWQFEDGKHHLYNLEQDPGEQLNLYGSDKHQQVQKTLESQLHRIRLSLPQTTMLEENPGWKKASLSERLVTKFRLRLKNEFYLLTDWLAEIYWGDKTARGSLWIILGFLMLFIIGLIAIKHLKNNHVSKV